MLIFSQYSPIIEFINFSGNFNSLDIVESALLITVSPGLYLVLRCNLVTINLVLSIFINAFLAMSNYFNVDIK